MLKKLKDILNTYTDEELDDMSLWFDGANEIGYVIVDAVGIILVSRGTELKIGGYIEQEGNNENN